jgi:hypothetical protein
MIFTTVIVNGVEVNTWEKKEIKEISRQLVTKAIRYPTCVPLAQNIRPNSMDEDRYVRGMQLITREYKHSEADLIKTKEILTNVSKNPGFFRMIDNTTYVTGNLPLIHLN